MESHYGREMKNGHSKAVMFGELTDDKGTTMQRHRGMVILGQQDQHHLGAY